jgi:hypothetical protein
MEQRGGQRADLAKPENGDPRKEHDEPRISNVMPCTRAAGRVNKS